MLFNQFRLAELPTLPKPLHPVTLPKTAPTANGAPSCRAVATDSAIVPVARTNGFEECATTAPLDNRLGHDIDGRDSGGFDTQSLWTKYSTNGHLWSTQA